MGLAMRLAKLLAWVGEKVGCERGKGACERVRNPGRCKPAWEGDATRGDQRSLEQPWKGGLASRGVCPRDSGHRHVDVGGRSIVGETNGPDANPNVGNNSEAGETLPPELAPYGPLRTNMTPDHRLGSPGVRLTKTPLGHACFKPALSWPIVSRPMISRGHFLFLRRPPTEWSRGGGGVSSLGSEVGGAAPPRSARGPGQGSGRGEAGGGGGGGRTIRPRDAAVAGQVDCSFSLPPLTKP